MGERSAPFAAWLSLAMQHVDKLGAVEVEGDREGSDAEVSR